MKENLFEMLEKILEIAGMIVTALSAIILAVYLQILF